MAKCGLLLERRRVVRMQSETAKEARDTKEFRPVRRRALRGRSAVSQARVILLVMINVAQLWILAATVEAALAHRYRVLIPLVIASFVCWLFTLSIVLWWRPV